MGVTNPPIAIFKRSTGAAGVGTSGGSNVQSEINNIKHSIATEFVADPANLELFLSVQQEQMWGMVATIANQHVLNFKINEKISELENVSG